jgi:membrane protease YdiL (CAAX protease family)
VGRPTLADLHISFQWNHDVALYAGIGALVVIIMSFFSTKSDASLEIYPEIRVRFWRYHIVWKSALTWIIYILAYELFYRGLLLQSLLLHMGEIQAIVACTALYSLSHYFKQNRLTVLSMVWGVVACLIVLRTGSLLATIIIHLTLALSVEWFSIRHHREMYIRRT